MNREGSPLRIRPHAKTEEIRHQSLPMDKDAVAEVLKEPGVLLELKGENPFGTRAYVTGARTLEGLTEPPKTLIRRTPRRSERHRQGVS